MRTLKDERVCEWVFDQSKAMHELEAGTNIRRLIGWQ